MSSHLACLNPAQRAAATTPAPLPVGRRRPFLFTLSASFFRGTSCVLCRGQFALTWSMRLPCPV